MREKREGARLELTLEGELDHHSAEGLREELDSILLNAPEVKELILDLRGMSFMDSSGIGVLLGRYKRMRARGGVLKLRCEGQVEKLLRLSGVFEVVKKA